jgi:Flp pilus assembly pilin Flp
MLYRARSIAGHLRKDERGATLMEYTVLLGLIVAVSVGTVLAFGNYIGTYFDTFKTSITGKMGTGEVK